MKLGYYQPMAGGEATASGLGVLGKTMSDLGQLSLDDKEKKARSEIENTKLNLMQNADKRGDAELKLSQDKFKNEETRTQAKALQEALDRKDMAGAFRTLHPKVTANLSDEQIMAWGKDIDKVLPKDVKIDKLDTRITPEGDKMLTYVQDGKIVEKNMGKVKTDWNVGKDAPSSDIPVGHTAVDESWFNLQKNPLPMSKTKDGRAYAKISDFNKWMSENPMMERDPNLNKHYNDSNTNSQKSTDDYATAY